MFSLIDNHHSFLRPSYTLTSALEAILDPLVSVLALYVITVLLGFTPGANYVILGVLCFSLMFPGNAGFHESTRRVVRKVVNISSVSGVFGNAGQANYSSAKAGIMGLTMTLAKEWGRLNTTVNCVAYGLIRTRMTEATANADATIEVEGREIKVGVNHDLMAMMERSIPMGRAGTPEEAAGAAYLFCIPESDYVSGQTVLCTGGLTGI